MPHLHCWGHGFNPSSGTKVLHALVVWQRPSQHKQNPNPDLHVTEVLINNMCLILYKRRKNISSSVFLKNFSGSLRGKGKAKMYFQKVWLLESLVAIDRDPAETDKGGTEFVMRNETVSQNPRAATWQDLDSWLNQVPKQQGELRRGSPSWVSTSPSSLQFYLFSKPWGRKYSPSTTPSLEFKTVEIFDQQISVKLLLLCGSQ